MSAEGWAKLNAGDAVGAEAAFKAVLTANQDDASSLHGLGRLALLTQQFDPAVTLLSRAYRLTPEDESLAIDYANALTAKSLKHPENAESHFELATALLGLGDVEAARDALLTALLAEPGHVPSRWLVNRPLPRVWASQAEMALWRRRLLSSVVTLEACIHPKSPEEAALHLPGILTRTNFELAYQAQDDRLIQETYGKLVHRVMSSWRPDLAEAPKSVPIVQRNDKRIRLGLASSYLTNHTISLFFSGLFANLDRGKFILHAYLTNGRPDSSTKALAGMCDVFRELTGPLDEAAESIHQDKLDVLIHLDVGMDARSFALAALKLAPVQMAAMGHPVTTGLPTIDYFLTGLLMEPEACEAHYSEKLIKLPNLSVAYLGSGTPQTKIRADFGLKDGDLLYLCCQAHQKYLPQDDHVFTDIAKQAPQAKFLFFKHHTRHFDNRRFESRLAHLFRSQGLDPARHLVILPRQEWQDFTQLYGLCDVFLDSFGWSGGNTSFEALARALPIVTQPSAFMRGRQSYAMLKVLGLDECIAKDKTDFVRIALRLGLDQDWNGQIRGRIKAGQGRLFNDPTPIRALESELAKLVAS